MRSLQRAVLAILVVAGTLAAGPVPATEKLALLIGNTSYPGAPGQPGAWDRLPNAANDVKLVAKSLRRDGFKVDVITDGTYKKISDAVARFALRSDGADFVVVYYAGHGFEYDRRNYLVPVDAPTSVREQDLAQAFVDFEQVANQVAQAKVNVFFLDACRTAVSFVQVTKDQTNSDVAAKAFDDVDYPQQTKLAVVYSTARGEPALDAAPPPSNFSPFAWEVARDVVVPRVDLAIVFETITFDVVEKTKGFNPSQAPYSYASLSPGIYFNDKEPPAPPVASAENVPPLGVDQNQLATTHEPVLIVRVLRDHSVQDIQSLAERGDAAATYLLGYMYEHGVGVHGDSSKARTWLEKSAASHTPAGELELGHFLEQHSSSADDKNRALALYESAASQNYAKAQAHLAIGLMDGTLGPRTPENNNRGVSLLRTAAGGGYPFAAFTLATRERTLARPPLSPSPPTNRRMWGTVLPRAGFAERPNPEGGEGQVKLKQTAGAGDPEASQWLCELSAGRGDYAAALPDCRIAARIGSATAEARLAIAYHNGLGVARSDDDARHWSRLALSQTALPDDLRSTLSTFGYTY